MQILTKNIKTTTNNLLIQKISPILCMSTVKQRKDIHLSPEVIEKLEAAATKEGRKLKNYMEKVLTKHSEKLKDAKANG